MLIELCRPSIEPRRLDLRGGHEQIGDRQLVREGLLDRIFEQREGELRIRSAAWSCRRPFERAAPERSRSKRRCGRVTKVTASRAPRRQPTRDTSAIA